MKKTTQADEFDAAEDDVLYRLRDLPACQRPRELLERFGVDSVEDEVLLAIILRSGTRGLNVLELARRLLQRWDHFPSWQRHRNVSCSDRASVCQSSC